MSPSTFHPVSNSTIAFVGKAFSPGQTDLIKFSRVHLTAYVSFQWDLFLSLLTWQAGRPPGQSVKSDGDGRGLHLTRKRLTALQVDELDRGHPGAVGPVSAGHQNAPLPTVLHEGARVVAARLAQVRRVHLPGSDDLISSAHLFVGKKQTDIPGWHGVEKTLSRV